MLSILDSNMIDTDVIYFYQLAGNIFHGKLQITIMHSSDTERSFRDFIGIIYNGL